MPDSGDGGHLRIAIRGPCTSWLTSSITATSQRCRPLRCLLLRDPAGEGRPVIVCRDGALLEATRVAAWCRRAAHELRAVRGSQHFAAWSPRERERRAARAVPPSSLLRWPGVRRAGGQLSEYRSSNGRLGKRYQWAEPERPRLPEVATGRGTRAVGDRARCMARWQRIPADWRALRAAARRAPLRSYVTRRPPRRAAPRSSAGCFRPDLGFGAGHHGGGRPQAHPRETRDRLRHAAEPEDRAQLRHSRRAPNRSAPVAHGRAPPYQSGKSARCGESLGRLRYRGAR